MKNFLLMLLVFTCGTGFIILYPSQAVISKREERRQQRKFTARIDKIMNALEASNKEKVTKLLKKYHDLNFGSPDCEKLLIEAAQKGLPLAMEELIKAGINKNTQNEAGLGIVLLVSGHKYAACLRILLNLKVQLAFPIISSPEVTALHVAALSSTSCLKELLTHKNGVHAQSINITYDTTKWNLRGLENKGDSMFTALHLCLCSLENEHVNRLKSVKLLLNADANIDAVTQLGYTALHFACFQGSPRCVRLLINEGAMVNPQTVEGITPLMITIKEMEFDCFLLLIAWKPDLSLQDVMGFTALHHAIQTLRVECVKILLLHNAPVHVAAKDGKTPLHMAQQRGILYFVILLLDKGANPLQIDASRKSPLHYALEKLKNKKISTQNEADDDTSSGEKSDENQSNNSTDRDIVELMCNALIDNFGYSRLLISVEVDSLRDCELALQSGRDKPINHALPNGTTALHRAIERGNADIVKLLINNGARVDLPDAQGRTAHDLISGSNDDSLIEFLNSYDCFICRDFTLERACINCAVIIHMDCFRRAYSEPIYGGKCPHCRSSIDQTVARLETILAKSPKEFVAAEVAQKRNELLALLPFNDAVVLAQNIMGQENLELALAQAAAEDEISE